MSARDSILDYERRQCEKRYDRAAARLSDMVKSPHYDVTELICRLLTSRVLTDAAGVLRKCGYQEAMGASPLSRMEFVVYFVGHEILDDGEPALCWHRYSSESREMFVDCEQDAQYAQPYWHRHLELAPKNSEYLSIEKALWTLDWHEENEERRYHMFNKFPGRNDQRKPEDPLMVALAEELRRAK